MKRFWEEKWFRTLIMLILVSVLIYMISLIDFIFAPLSAYISAIAVPIVVAGVLFYITNPLVNLMEKYRIPRLLGILIIFILLSLIIYLASIYIAPIVQEQVSTLIDLAPFIFQSAQEWIIYWQENRSALPEQLDDQITNFTDQLGTYAENFTTGMLNFITSLFSFLFSFVLTPFFLFFMLKDGHKLVPYLTQFMSDRKSNSFERLAGNVHHTLASFIQGQFLVSCFVGTGLYIGYRIIELNYSLSLALVALILNVIPFLGPILSAVPAILVAFFQDPIMALWVLIISVIIQQLDGNLISPNIMGKVLHLHPLTIITLIMAAGGIAGFIGLLFIIPAYAVIKTIIAHFYGEWQKKQPIGEREIL